MKIELTKVEEGTRDTKKGPQTGIRYVGIRIDGDDIGDPVAERFLSDDFDSAVANVIRNAGVGGKVDILMVNQPGTKYWNPKSATIISNDASGQMPAQQPAAGKAVSTPPAAAAPKSVLTDNDFDLVNTSYYHTVELMKLLSKNDIAFKKISASPDKLYEELKKQTTKFFKMLKLVRDGKKETVPPPAPVVEKEPEPPPHIEEQVPAYEKDDDVPF